MTPSPTPTAATPTAEPHPAAEAAPPGPAALPPERAAPDDPPPWEAPAPTTPAEPEADAPAEALEPPPGDAWEALPEDFWDRELEHEAPEAAKASRAAAPLGAPLFAELQSLFPGRVVRLESREAGTEAADAAPEEPEADAQDGLFQD